ncbi:phage tail tape measure protein [Corynebacterium sp. H127]|uniref:phage tail tape measure protein n=1 Tax=Corynebacterium sp. H127 TaxID=3133418 RepID=UPI0030B02EB6
MAGGKIDILVEPDVKGFGPKLESGLSGAIGIAGKIGAGLGVAMGGAEIFKGITAAGMDFQTQMNTLSGVTQATGAQLDQVSAKARELGNDNNLTATSASDAAAAMTELAKGGFTVEQSMDAAKGTLQLAAAAQIDAASAATIQSQALQAYNLGAGEAARVSDLLAGGANASSAEINGVAQALQQSGAVANQFGVSIDDTVTSVAMLANAGIQGSDAGTLLKSSMLALTDTSKPAQGAIKDLGLTVYDAQGKFVGMRSLMEQLQTASESMTEEQYQAATATLFGSDAMRLAGVAAVQGGEGFDKLKEAVTRQGQAAKLSEENNKGLPGALGRLENAAEAAALGVYRAIDDSLIKGADLGAKSLEKLGSSAAKGAEVAVREIGEIGKALQPAASATLDFAKGHEELAQAAGMAAAGLALSAWIDFPGRASKGTSAVRNFGEAMQVQQSLAKANGAEIGRMGSALAVLESRSPAFQTIATAARQSSSGLMAASAAHKEAATAWKIHALTATTSSQAIGFATKSATNSVVAGSARMAGALKGGVAGGFAGLKLGASGLMSALGGPWALALTGATMAVGSAVAGMQAMNAVLAESKNLSHASTDAYRNMFDVLASGGAAIDSAEKSVESLRQSISSITSQDLGWFQRGKLAAGDFFESLGGTSTDERKGELQIRQLADDAKAADGVLRDLGLTNRDLASTAIGAEEAYGALREQLMAQGRGGEFLVSKLDGMRESMLAAQESFERIGPSGAKAAHAIEEVGEQAGDAASRTDKLRTAFMELAGINITAEQAAAELTKTLANVSENLDEVAGASLTAEGGIDVTAKSGVALHEALNEIGSAMQRSVASGENANAVFARSSDELEAMRQAAGIGTEEWQKLLEQMQMTPEKMSIIADVETDAAQAELAQVGAWAETFEGTPITKNLIVKSEEAQEQLRSFGFDVETINRETGEVKLTMKDEEARDKLDWWMHTGMPETDGSVAEMEILMDTTQLDGSAEHAKGIIDALDIEKPSPQAKLIIDEVLKGKDIAVGELAALTAESAIPKADLDKALFDAGINLSEDQLNLLSSMLAKPTADVNNEPLKAGVRDSQSHLDSLKDKTVTIRIQEWKEYYSSGRATDSGGTAVGQQYASGGKSKPHNGYRLPGTGPGTGQTDGFLGVDASGMPLARLDANEWVINGRSSQKYDRELAAINAGVFPKLQGYKDGGRVASPDELLRFFRGEDVNGQRAARSLEMAEYVFSGSNWGDCSSTQGQGALFAAGLPATNGRYMATMDEDQKLAGIGFLPGLGSGPRLAIGWFNGGEWGGHTSGTIHFEDGSRVNVEMGGGRGNGQIGGGAAGADHSQYTNQRHLPLAAGAGSGISDADYYDADSASAYTPSARSSPGTTSKSNAPTSWSQVAGIAASEFASGQVKDILGVFGIPDTPPALAAYAQYQDAQGGDAAGVGGQVNKVDDAKIMELETKLANAESELEIKQMKVNELTEKSSPSSRASAELAVTKQQQEIDKLKRQIEAERGGQTYKVNKDGTLGSKVKEQIVDPQTGQGKREASPADMAAVYGEMTRAVVGDRPGVQPPAVVGDIFEQIKKRLGINVMAMASGGMLSASQATAVPPGAFRLIGDRLDKDEFFLPDDDSSLGVGAEWARRRGYQLTRIGQASQQSSTAGTTAQQTQIAGSRTTTYNLHGPDSRDLLRQLEARELAATMKHLGG